MSTTMTPSPRAPSSTPTTPGTLWTVHVYSTCIKPVLFSSATTSRISWTVTSRVSWPAECSPRPAPCPLACPPPPDKTDSSLLVRSSSTDSPRDSTSTSSHSSDELFYQHQPYGVKPRRTILVFYLLMYSILFLLKDNLHEIVTRFSCLMSFSGWNFLCICTKISY